MKKKWYSVFFAVLLCVALSVPALVLVSAEEAPAAILIDDTSDGTHFTDLAKGVLPYGAEEGKTSIIGHSNHGMRIVGNLPQKDISSVTDGPETVLTLWIYILNDKYLTNDGQIEITSSGRPDTEELSWVFGTESLAKAGYESGKWNKLELSFRLAAKVGGDFNPQKLNYFRLYSLSSDPYDGGNDFMSVIVSDIWVEVRPEAATQQMTVVQTVTPEKTPSPDDVVKPPLTNGVNINDMPTGEDVAKPTGNCYVLDTCDTPDNWNNVLYADKRNYIEGTGCLYNSNPTMTVNAIFNDLDTSKLPAYDDAYLEMYVYVENPDRMSTVGGAGQIELNSTGVNDVGEIFFDFTPEKIALKAGWNFVSIKLTDFNPTDGKFVYSKLMGMRIYSISKDGANNTLRVDYITITDAPCIDYIRAHGFEAHSEKPFAIGTVPNEKTDLNSVKEIFEN